MVDPFAFGRILKKEIQKKGYTLAYVSKQVGKSESTLRSYLSGKTLPRANTIIKFIKLFECSSDYLVGLKDEFGNNLYDSPNRQDSDHDSE